MTPSTITDAAPVMEERKITPLPPPLRLETGSIVTLRMRGHSRTNGLEYYAPAVVLNQYQDAQGSVEVLVWDSSAGTHYQASYPVREISVRGDGAEREMYEAQSNIGQVLFSPDQFALALMQIEELQARVARLEKSLHTVMDAGRTDATGTLSQSNVSSTKSK